MRPRDVVWRSKRIGGPESREVMVVMKVAIVVMVMVVMVVDGVEAEKGHTAPATKSALQRNSALKVHKVLHLPQICTSRSTKYCTCHEICTSRSTKLCTSKSTKHCICNNY